MTEASEKIIGYCDQILGENPGIRATIRIASGAELAEKLTIRSAKEAYQLAQKAGFKQEAEELDRKVGQGRFDEAVGLAEGIYRKINPDAKDSLVGMVFDSLLQVQEPSD